MITLHRPQRPTDSISINIVDSQKGIIDRLVWNSEKWFVRSHPDVFFETPNEAFNAYAELHGIPLKAVYLMHDEVENMVKIFDDSRSDDGWVKVENPSFQPPVFLRDNPFAFSHPDLVLISLEDETIYPVGRNDLAVA